MLESKKRSKTSAKRKEEYFEHYCANGFSVLATAEHFDVLRQTMDRISHQDDWRKRAKEVKVELRKRVDKRIVANEMSNLKIVQKIKTKIRIELEKKKKLKPTIRDLLAVLQYEDTLLGNMPSNEADHIVQLFVGTNGNERETEHLDRNLGVIFGNSNGAGEGVKVGSTASRLPKDG